MKVRSKKLLTDKTGVILARPGDVIDMPPRKAELYLSLGHVVPVETSILSGARLAVEPGRRFTLPAYGLSVVPRHPCQPAPIDDRKKG